MNNESIYIALKDSRVVKLIGPENGNKTLLLSLINNFPENWNRNEINEGILELSYSIMYDSSTVNYSKANRFGWEINTDPVIRNSWFRSKPASGSYLTIDNPNIIPTNDVIRAKDPYVATPTVLMIIGMRKRAFI